MLDVSYRLTRRRVLDLVAELDDNQLCALVPATPEWTVHDVLAHLVGGASDAAHGRVDGAPGPRWTERHVAERRGAPLDALLTEWDRDAPIIEKGLAGVMFTGPNIAADLLCHESDLREALGFGRVGREHWHDQFLEGMMHRLNRQLGDSVSVVIHDEHGRQWRCGDGRLAATVRADGYELLRATFSRRSRRQIAAWDWTPAPDVSVIDAFGFFGPRDDDQPVPR